MRALLGCVAVLAAAVGAMLAVALGPGARPARAALPCGLLNPCSTTTATTATTPPTTTATAPPTTTIPATTAQVVYAGKRYDGRAPAFKWGVTLGVVKSGQALTDFGVEFNVGRCSDGTAYSGFDIDRHAVDISATGTVSQTVTSRHAFFYNRSGKKVTGTETFTVHMQFHGTKLTGTLIDSFRGAGLSCHSGPVRYAGYVDGSTQAPLRDDFAATGTYRGDGVTARVFLPWHEISEITFPYTLHCPHAKPIRGTLTYTQVPLKTVKQPATESFSLTYRDSSRLPKGLTAKTVITASGDFTSLGAASSGEGTENETIFELGTSVTADLSVYNAQGRGVKDYCSGAADQYLKGPTIRDLVN